MGPTTHDTRPFSSKPAVTSAVLAVLLIAVGCGDRVGGTPTSTPTDPQEPRVAPVVVAEPHEPQAAETGVPFAYDATLAGRAFQDQSGTGLQYSIRFAPHPNGLTARDGVISGTPVEPLTMSVVVTATNGKGAKANAHLLIVAFDSSLVAPTLATAGWEYGKLPGHVTSQAAMIVSDNKPAGSTITPEIATLGRVLFYDRRLSANDRVACASCHVQQFGFADTARFSRGFAGGRTRRQAMSLVNVRFYQPNRFFWDERAASLEQLVLMPIQDPVEMGLPASQIIPKLRVAGFYAPLFDAAFGSPSITLDRVSTALAQFLRSMTSYRARFDEPLAATGNAQAPGHLTPQELRGLALFEDNCLLCHTSVGQVAQNARNNGLDAIATDVGVGDGRFKVPSLRNIEVTAPYMHDGRFRSLEEVVEFYDSGVQKSPVLDPLLRERDGTPAQLRLSTEDKAALVAFLRTLTDHEFLKDPRFADPFVRKP